VIGGAAAAPEALRPGAACRQLQLTALVLLAAFGHMVPCAATAAAAVWLLVEACRQSAYRAEAAAASHKHSSRTA
jgi:hypothetical protein